MATADPRQPIQPSEDLDYQRTLDRLTTIAQITNPVVGASPLRTQVHELLRQVRAAYQVDACVARTLENGELVLLSACGVPASKLVDRQPVDVGIAGEMIRERRPVAIEYADRHPVTAALARNARRNASVFEFISYAGAPLLVERRLVGVLGLYTTERPRRFTFIELNHLQIVANHIAISIVNDRLYGELRRRKEDLQQEIRQRAQAEEQRHALEEQLRQAQKMEAVGQLAGGIAHDFSNILTAILGHVELAKSKLLLTLAPNDPALDGITQIEQSASKAADLTRQLLAFSRRQITLPKVVDLNEILARTETMLRRLVTENIALTFERGAALKPIHADPRLIEQALLNLIVNARDAMPDGGELIIESRNVTLDDAYSALHPEAVAGPSVLLAITDTGRGMSEETLEHMFEPFFTTKPAGKRTGLGLATVYGIVKQAGGSINVYSEPDHGTVFKLYFPAVEETTDRHQRADTGRELLTGTETILLCEDDDAVRDLMCRMLRYAGYTVLVAGSGAQAKRLSAEHAEPIHLLITDVIMSDTNGPTLANALVSDRPDMKILYVSGYTSTVITRHGALDPDVEFLEKPFTRQGLLQRTRQLLDADRA